MLCSNEPDHRWRRAPLSSVFASRLIAELRPRIRAIAGRYIDSVYAQGEMNFLDQSPPRFRRGLSAKFSASLETDVPRFTGRVYQLRGFRGSYECLITNEKILKELEPVKLFLWHG